MFLSLFLNGFEDFPDVFVTLFSKFFVTFSDVFVTLFCAFFDISFPVFQRSIINISFHAITLTKTPKFSESSELIIYLTCEERRLEPSTLFSFKIWFERNPNF